MKVLQVIPAFQVAGAEVMCENLCYALSRQGCDVIAVSLYTEHTLITERLKQAGIRIIFLGKKEGFDFSVYRKLYHIVKKEKPDVVHSHIYAAHYALPVGVVCNVPARIHTVHSVAQQEQNAVGRLINKWMFQHFKVIPVALSNEIRKTVMTVYNITEQCIPVVPNGVDLSKCEVKKSYARGKTFRIIHVGRFADVKNHDLILKSFAQFVQGHPDAQLQLIGDGELEESMKSFARDLHIDQAVNFMGRQKNVFSWLHDADLFILPSKYEGMPMSIIEAMGTGLPIITCSSGGVLDMLSNGYSAILIKPSVDNLCQAFEVLYNDKNLREMLGVHALNESKNYSSDMMAKQYIRVYSGQM